MASIGHLTGNNFSEIDIMVISNMSASVCGGGVVGAHSWGSNTVALGDLSGNSFTGITLTAGTDIQGGGIVGSYSYNASATASIGLITGNEFAGNTVTSHTGSIYGGLIYARSLGNIVNSSFTGNTFSATGTDQRVFGAVTLDTSSAASVGKLTVMAKDGGQTVFANNLASDSLGANRPAESLYLGRLDPGNDSRHSATHAQLDIDARPCSLIDLADPIRAEQDSGFNFTMNVLGSGGEFRWGGINVIDVAAAGTGRIDFKSSSRTWLYEGFGLADANGNVNVTLSSGAELRLPVPAAYDPSTVPYIKANSVEISGLVALDERPVPRIGLAEGDVVLKLEDSSHVIQNAALGSGRLYRRYDPSYRNYALAWGDGSSTSANDVVVKFLGDPTYDPELGGSDTRTGTNVIAANRPEMELARDHLRSFFLSREKKTPARQLWVDTSFSSSRLRDGRLGLSSRLETPALLAGTDLHATEDTVVGLAVGISRPKYRGDHTQLEADETLLMAYGAMALPNGLELSGDIAAGRARYRHHRKVEEKDCSPCSAPYRDYSDSYRGHDLLAGLELAHPVALENGWEVRPFVSQDYIRQTVGGYTEKGEGDWALKSERQRNELWITRVGTGIAWRGEEQGRGWRFTGGGQAYWQGRSGDLSAAARVAFRDDTSGALYRSEGERLPRHALGLGFHAAWSRRDRMHVRLGYDLRVSRREITHEGNVRVEWNW